MNGALPLWVIALVAAAVAPWGARTLATAFDRRVRERTARLVGSIAALGRPKLQEGGR
jgi:hypothetical protein